jgi:hypothetical protein
LASGFFESPANPTLNLTRTFLVVRFGEGLAEFRCRTRHEGTLYLCREPSLVSGLSGFIEAWEPSTRSGVHTSQKRSFRHLSFRPRWRRMWGAAQPPAVFSNSSAFPLTRPRVPRRMLPPNRATASRAVSPSCGDTESGTRSLSVGTNVHRAWHLAAGARSTYQSLITHSGDARAPTVRYAALAKKLRC